LLQESSNRPEVVERKENRVETPSIAELEGLFDHYLAHGCPCRFPRFRATVGRDLKEIGAPDWDISDVRPLLETFDRRVPLLESSRDAWVTRGTCRFCGARIVRSGAPVFRDSFIERAQILPGAPADVGAPAGGPVPVCGQLFPAGPGNVSKTEAERIKGAYPRLNSQDWLAYLRALA